MKFHKFKSFRFSQKWIGENSGLASMQHRKPHRNTYLYNKQETRDLVEGFYNPDYVDPYKEIVTLDKIIRYLRGPLETLEMNYAYRYNLFDEKFLKSFYLQLQKAHISESHYIFLRSTDKRTFSYGTSLPCKCLSIKSFGLFRIYIYIYKLITYSMHLMLFYLSLFYISLYFNNCILHFVYYFT